jgi:hypothetical protein
VSFTVAFFTHGEHLVPVVRDILEPPGMIRSPGRVWSEPGDGGMPRASLPFVLTNPDDNTTRNGLATFLYDDTRVSALRLQVVQENVPWRDKFDAWGQAAMTYTPGPIPNEAALQAQFAVELQQQTPIRSWSALPAASGAPGLEGFDGPHTMFVSADGGLYGRFKGAPDVSTEDDVGRWHITPEGQFCRTWHVWDSRRERCYAVYREGETFAFSPHDRFVDEVYRGVPGNPEGY